MEQSGLLSERNLSVLLKVLQEFDQQLAQTVQRYSENGEKHCSLKVGTRLNIIYTVGHTYGTHYVNIYKSPIDSTLFRGKPAGANQTSCQHGSPGVWVNMFIF